MANFLLDWAYPRAGAGAQPLLTKDLLFDQLASRDWAVIARVRILTHLHTHAMMNETEK